MFTISTYSHAVQQLRQMQEQAAFLKHTSLYEITPVMIPDMLSLSPAHPKDTLHSYLRNENGKRLAGLVSQWPTSNASWALDLI